MNKIWTVYYRKENEVMEMAMHFENEDDALTFKEVASNKGYFAYLLNERVYTNYKKWMKDCIDVEI